ncbi:hypothetical protein KIN20_025041 [Parelaphostrongylus tenuis]|uniref:Uncharacterized protein n=1 Tax=Parelaphostrongylus tenuis TaxID=148309 RepID=A0AAD5QXQ0_PARTN|nr:hypothetical protein KIN20_025041 [Parelaphostrongylus tenuis]
MNEANGNRFSSRAERARGCRTPMESSQPAHKNGFPWTLLLSRDGEGHLTRQRSLKESSPAPEDVTQHATRRSAMPNKLVE